MLLEAMGKFLKNMSLVYLDQFASSRLISTSNDVWSEIRSVLLSGVKKRRLLCPRSLEHMIETAPLEVEIAVKIDSLLNELSFGWSVLHESRVTAWQFISRVRGQKPSKQHFLEKKALKSLAPNHFEDLRKTKHQFGKIIKDCTVISNEIETILRPHGGIEKAHWLSSIAAAKNTEVKELKKKLWFVAAGFYPPKEEIMAASVTFPKWSNQLIEILMRRHYFLPSEAKKALSILEEEGVDGMPALCIRTELSCVHGFRHARMQASDQFDIMRLAAVLPYADVILTDGGKTQDIRDLGLNERYATMVFGSQTLELDKFCEHLKRLVSS